MGKVNSFFTSDLVIQKSMQNFHPVIVI